MCETHMDNMNRSTIFSILVLSVTLSVVVGQSTLFCDFGVDAGDVTLEVEDPEEDDFFSPEFPLSIALPFYNGIYDTIFVSANGLLTFLRGTVDSSPDPFPASGNKGPIVAPFWSDVSLPDSPNGSITYREVNDTETLCKISLNIRRAYDGCGFTATWAFIATYFRLRADENPPFAAPFDAENSFQVVLASDGTQTFAIFNYLQQEWLSDDGGPTRLPQIGFDSGDGTNFFALPDARRLTALNLFRTSNVGVPGQWIYRVDGADGVENVNEGTSVCEAGPVESECFEEIEITTAAPMDDVTCPPVVCDCDSESGSESSSSESGSKSSSGRRRGKGSKRNRKGSGSDSSD